jgi:hypothetical protein
MAIDDALKHKILDSLASAAMVSVSESLTRMRAFRPVFEKLDEVCKEIIAQNDFVRYDAEARENFEINSKVAATAVTFLRSMEEIEKQTTDLLLARGHHKQ